MGITERELEIFHKLTSSKLFMRDISKTSRGLPFQKYVTKDTKGVPVYRGDHVGRYALYSTTETIPETILDKANKKISFLRQPKILSQRIIAHVLYPSDHIILMSTLDEDGILTLDTVENTVLTDNRFGLGFIVGLLNSKFWSWYAYSFIFSKAIRTMDFDDYYLGKFPLPSIDFDNPAEKKLHDDLVALVNKMLELNKKLKALPHFEAEHRQALEKEIEHVDKTIDGLVYKLYDLTGDEIEIAESRQS